VYDRRYGDKELTFEASGALLKASLVMRDRETDSWWSIMTSNAIGGELAGSDLIELPVSEKTTWRDWRARHPDSKVLSIEGREHEPRDGYADYWRSDRTFRDLEITDDRLPAKEPVFAFWVEGQPYAVAHRDFEGGSFFDLDEGGELSVYLVREAGAPLHASSRAFLVPATAERGELRGEEVLAALERAGAEPLAGFDTFWYSWISIQEGSRLLR
jgi:hypothetical protein